jgi:hypothetical protein
MKSVMLLGVVGGFVLVLAATMPAAAARKPGGVAQAQAGRAMSGSVVVDTFDVLRRWQRLREP